MRMVEYINLNGKITNRGAKEMFSLSNEGALDEIDKLIKLQVLESEGKGRSIHYILG